MSSNYHWRRSWCVRACALLLWVLTPILAAAQTPSPWNGAIGRELFSHAVAGEHSMSADGNVQVFETDAPLAADDTNGTTDVYVRDAYNGFVFRVSVGTGPIPGIGAPQGDQPSGSGVVSPDGRHIVFRTRNSFDPTDTNGVSDLYVRDMGSGITSLVTVGPADQRLDCECAPLPVGRFSGDGRFIVFNADFRFAGGSLLWIRDRDTEGISSFDYPPTVRTTAIDDVRSVGSDLLSTINNVAISRDGRYVAFIAGAVDQGGQALGTRVYLHDRQLGTTIRVDRPLPSSGDVVASAFSPDFSDNGLLVYTSTAPNLVPGDADATPDVFVYDIASGTQERLTLTHGSFNLLEAYGTVISSDGRYVAFTGYEEGSGGSQRWSVFAFDRAEHTSHDVSLLLDGTRDPEAIAVGMSADGLQIAYWSSNRDVVYDGPQASGLYVATTVGLSPPEVTARTDGELVPIEITVPANVTWTARLVSGDRDDYTEYETHTGIGPATIEVNILSNQTGIPATYQVWLGSKAVTIRQPITPVIVWIDHEWSTTTGGEPFQIFGFNFQPGATVTFGDVFATGVTVEVGEFDATISGIVPPHQSGGYRVVVHNPDGEISPDEIYFYYYDETPPVVTANVSGTLGANGWYTSDVSIDWTVEDPDSGISTNTCVPVTQTTDVALRTIFCYATNGEGSATDSWVELKRDATAPVIAIAQPQSQAYRQGQSVAIQFSCSDATSGVASCTGNQTGTLDTSALGSFSFVVTAVDLAGNTATTTVAYTVIPKPTLRVIAINTTKVYGEALPAFSVVYDGFVNGDTAASLGGTLSFSTAATATSAPGSYSVTPGGYTAANYSIEFVAGTLTVTRAATTLALSSTPNPSHPNQTVQLNVAVSAAAPGAGVPTGWVQFRDNDTVIGLAPLVNGVATMSRKFKMGTHSLTAIYFGDGNFVSSNGSAQHQTN